MDIDIRRFSSELCSQTWLSSANRSGRIPKAQKPYPNPTLAVG